MPGHASSLRKHDRKVNEWERTKEFPLARTKSFLFQFEIKKGKDKGEGKDRIRMRMMAGVWPGSSASCRQVRLLGGPGLLGGEWEGESGEELAYLGLKHPGWQWIWTV